MGRKRTKGICVGCGTKGDESNPVTFDACPYASELECDDTKVWLCSECSSLRACEI